ncbi:MAG: phage related tail fiber protein, partial [Candidatus Angelobacter sp.]|nr:phage related tail fiber protein [Candidatus Angelobacter sp.]
ATGFSGSLSGDVTGPQNATVISSLDAAKLTGTVSDARLSANVPTRDGGNTFTNGKQGLAASTSAYASLNVASGAGPTSPVSGDVWNEAGLLKFNPDGVAGNTKTIAFTDSLANLVAVETARATAAEAALSTNLNNEVTRATGAEGTLTSDVATANTAITTNANAIATANTGIASNATEISNETTRATGAETTLSTNIGSEVTRATGAESTLTTNLAAANTAIAANTANITANTSAIATDASAITAETTRATGAESTLTTNLSAETAARQAADTALTTNVAAATSAATANNNAITAANTAITNNANAITAEATRATSAEGVLTASVAAADAAILTNTNAIAAVNTTLANNTTAVTGKAKLDGGNAFINGTQILAASTNTYASLNMATGLIPTAPNAGDFWNESGAIKFNPDGVAANTKTLAFTDSVNTSVAAETARATAAEATLTTNLSAATTAISANTADIATNTANIAANTAATTSNATAISNETTRATGAETTLSTTIGNEVTRATAAEGALTTSIGNEVTRATGAESTLTTNLAAANTAIAANTANIAANTTAITNNANAITGETSARQAADATLTNDIATANAAITTNANAISAANTAITTNGNAITAANTAIANNANAITAEAARASSAEGVLTANVAAADAAILTNSNAIAAVNTALANNTTAVTGKAKLDGGNAFINGKQTLAQGTVGYASLNLPEGVAPTSAVSGDIWNSGISLQYQDNTNATHTVAFTDSVNTSVAAETARATAAEATLTTNLSNEITRATAAEGTLTSNLSATNTAISANTTNIATNTANIATNTAAIAGNATAISNETTRASAVEGTLTTSIGNEVARATSAETTLTTNLSSETTARQAADTTLTNNLATANAAIAANTTAITNNANAITGETTRATGAESTLTTNLATANAAISANTTNISANTAAITSNASAITAETTRATGAESTLTTNLTTANTAISNNAATITAEAVRATAAEGTLTTNLAAANTAITGKANLAGGNSFTGGKQILPVATVAYASLNVANGATPTAPVAGDVWNQTGALKFNPDGVVANTKTIAFTDSNLTGNAAGFTGSLAGDVTGGQGSTLVSKIQGTPVSSTAPTGTQVLAFNGTQWQPMTPTTGTVTNIATGAGLTGGPITSTGTISIANAGVNNAMLANSAVTVTAGTGLSGGGAVSLGGSTTLNLANTTVTAGTYTKLTVDAQGRATAGATAQFSDLGGSIAAAQMPALTGDVTSSAGSTATTLASVVTAGTNTKITYDAKGRVTGGTQAAFSDLSGSIAATQLPALTGDVTSTAGTAATTLANSGVTAGTYNKVTVDAKGRVTAGSALTFLAADVSGILPIANGGTGSNTQNFVDLSTAQSVAGTKAFTGTLDASAATSTMPVHVSSTFPATCAAQSEMLIKTGAVTAGQQLYICNAAGNGWNITGDGLGSNNNLSFNPVAIAANSVNLVKNACTTTYTGAYPAFVAGQDIPIPPASGSLSSTSTLVASVLSSAANAMPSSWDSYHFQAYVDNSGTKSFLHVCNFTLTSFVSSGAITFNVRAIN